MGDVEERRRLVEQQDVGVLGQRHGDPRSLALPTGQRRDGPLDEVGDAGRREGVGDGRLVVRRPASEPALVGIAAATDQVPDGDAVRGDGGLGKEPDDPRHLDRRQLGDGPAVEHDRTAPRTQQPGQTAKERRLPRRVRADDHRQPSVGDGDVEAADDVGAAVAEDQAVCPQPVRCPPVPVVAHPPRPSRFVVASSQTRYGAPTRPVTTPVGRATGRRWLATRSAARTRPGADEPRREQAARCRAEEAHGDRTGDERHEGEWPGRGRRDRDEHDRHGDQPEPGPSPRAHRARPAASSPSSSARSGRPSSQAIGRVTATATSERRDLGRLGEPDRADQPGHRLAGVVDLGARQEIADERQHELRDADADEDEAVADDPVPPRQNVDEGAAHQRPDQARPRHREPAGSEQDDRRHRGEARPGRHADEVGEASGLREQASGRASRRPRARCRRPARSTAVGSAQLPDDEVDGRVRRRMAASEASTSRATRRRPADEHRRREQAPRRSAEPDP